MWRNLPRSSTEKLAGFLLAALVALSGPAHAAGPAPPALDAILDGGNYQTELPLEAGWVLEVPAGFRAMATVVLYTIAAIGIVTFAIWAFREIEGREAASGTAGNTAVGDAGALDVALEDAERLARDGRFGEAVHMLFLVAVSRLAIGLPTPPSAAATGRELMQTLPLPAGYRGPFRDLVHDVERWLFGGRHLTRDDYDRHLRTLSGMVTP